MTIQLSSAASSHLKCTPLEWNLRTILSSIAMTLAVFLAIPMVEALVRTRPDTIALRPVETTRIPPPSLPSIHSEPAPESERSIHIEPVPELALPQPQLQDLEPLVMPSLVMGRLAGDFDVTFKSLSRPSAPVPGNMAFSLEEIDKAPLPIVQIPPPYPVQARLRKIEGTVSMELRVNSEGIVEDVKPLAPRTHKVLERAALQAARQWRFQPAMKNGHAVAVRVIQHLTFRLEE